MTHRGKIVEKVARQTDTPIKTLAKELDIGRSTVYRNFEDPELPYETIQAYGKVLKYDFSEVFPDMVVTEHVYSYKPKNIQELESERDFWKDKYISLLERYNKLILKQYGLDDEL